MDGARARYGEDPWFRLGDRDLATHIVRTARLRDGDRPTDGRALELQRPRSAIGPRILPMTDEPVRTEVRTDDGWLEFQDYFVRRHQEPEVREVRFRGIEAAPADARGRRGARGGRGRSSSRRRTRSCRSARSSRVAGMADRGGGRRRVAARRSSRCAGSSAAGRSRARPIGCWSRSATRRARSAWPGCYAGLVDVFVLDTVDADLEPAIAGARPRGRVVTDTIMADDAGAAPGVAATVLEAARRADPGRDEFDGATPDRPRRIVAIVPVRGLDGAKIRLGADLDAEERRDLVDRAGSARTIGASVATPRRSPARSSSRPDREVRELARGLGARTASPARARPQRRALARPGPRPSPRGADAVLVLPVDLPRDHRRGRRRRSIDAARRRAGPGGVVARPRPARAGHERAASRRPTRSTSASAARAASRASRRGGRAGARYVELDGPLAARPRHARRTSLLAEAARAGAPSRG